MLIHPAGHLSHPPFVFSSPPFSESETRKLDSTGRKGKKERKRHNLTQIPSPSSNQTTIMHSSSIDLTLPCPPFNQSRSSVVRIRIIRLPPRPTPRLTPGPRIRQPLRRRPRTATARPRRLGFASRHTPLGAGTTGTVPLSAVLVALVLDARVRVVPRGVPVVFFAEDRPEGFFARLVEVSRVRGWRLVAQFFGGFFVAGHVCMLST
jgi:hypothetical protein